MGNAARAIADAGMDTRLRDFLRQAHRDCDRARIEEAQRALRIRRNPKFLALVDLIDGLDPTETRGRHHPERVAAAARLLDTAAIELEPDTTRRARLAAAKEAVRAILTELRVEDHARRHEITRQILVMARDWAVARAKQKLRVQMHLSANRVAAS